MPSRAALPAWMAPEVQVSIGAYVGPIVSTSLPLEFYMFVCSRVCVSVCLVYLCEQRLRATP